MNRYIEEFKKDQIKVTRTRAEMLDIFLQTSEPINAVKILEILHKKDPIINKTTVYRELDFLLDKNIIKEIFINGKTQYYEIADSNEHHHMICKNCMKIEDFIPNKELEQSIEELAKKLKKKNSFEVSEHALEFFGLCINCQNK